MISEENFLGSWFVNSYKELKLTKQKYSGFKSKDILAQDLKARGLDIFSWSGGPGTRYAPHQHSHDEVIVVENSNLAGDLYNMSQCNEG